MKKIAGLFLFISIVFFQSCSNNKEYYLKTGFYTISETPTDYKRFFHDNRSYNILPKAIVDVSSFKEVQMSNYEGRFLIVIVLTDSGTKILSTATEKLAGKFIVFIVDDNIIMVPKLSGQIKDGSIMVDGDFTEQQMVECYDQIKSSMNKIKD